MYCYRSRENERIVDWGTVEDEKVSRQAPLLFPTRRDAEEFAQAVGLRKKAFRLKQIEKLQPCWIYQDGGFCWVSPLTAEDIAAIKVGPIRHPDGLAPELEQMCRQTYQQVGRYLCHSYEHWELGFLRDMHPAEDLETWVFIADAHRRYMADHPAADAKQAVAFLSAVSTGVADPCLDEIRRYYTGPCRPITLIPDTKAAGMNIVMSAGLRAIMSCEEAYALALGCARNTAWKEHGNTTDIIQTVHGDVMLIWAWEERSVLLSLLSEFDKWLAENETNGLGSTDAA